jgi:hypothetical protein
VADDFDSALALFDEPAPAKKPPAKPAKAAPPAFDSALALFEPAAPPAPDISGRDAGPAARRAAAGKPRDPILDATPLENDNEPVTVTPTALGRFSDAVNDRPPGTSDTMAASPAYAAGRRANERAGSAVANDPLAQTVIASTVGAGAGALAKGALSAAPAIAQRLVPAAVAGGTASKAEGGDFTTGAVLGAAAEAAPVAGQLVKEGVKKIAAPLVPGAEARVTARAVQNVIEGDAGGVARKKLRDRVMARAGDELGNVKPLFADHPELRDELAAQAARNPARAHAFTQGVIEQVGAETAPMLDAMTKATGGARVIDLVSKFDQVRRKYLAAGKLDAAQAADRARLQLIAQYGVDGTGRSKAISEAVRIPARSVQNMKNAIGPVAFPDLTTPARLKAEVSRDLWGALDGELEGMAKKTPGLDLARLRRLNQDMSVLLPMRDALKDRAAQAAANRTGLIGAVDALKKTVAHASGGVLGHMVGGEAGAALGVGLPLAYKGAAAAGRAADLWIARLGTAAQRGAIPQSLVTQAQAAGVPAGVIAGFARRAQVVPDQPVTGQMSGIPMPAGAQ